METTVHTEMLKRLEDLAAVLYSIGAELRSYVKQYQPDAPATPDLFHQEEALEVCEEHVADEAPAAPTGDTEAHTRTRHVGELGQKRWTPAERESLRRLIATGADDRTIYDTYIINNRPRTFHAVIREIYSQRMTARAIAARNR